MSDHDDESLDLGEFDTEREAALAYDRAYCIIHGDNVLPEDLNFPEHEIGGCCVPPEIMRKLLAARERLALKG